jgi:hypothetical protein
MVTGVEVPTGVVLMLNAADDCPAATNTLAGTVALVEFDPRVTVSPPVGAFPFRVTVPVDELLPITVAGETETLESATGLIVRPPVIVMLSPVAEIVATVRVVTLAVVTVNVAEVEPAATVTVAGTIALALLDDSDITAPPDGAGPLTVIVAVDDAPPTTVEGVNVSKVG